MTATIIDGKLISQKVKDRVAAHVALLAKKPGLAVILVGEDPASQTYVGSKEKTCIALGMHSIVDRLPATTTQEALLKRIHELNVDPTIHGILVQLPLPQHIDENTVTLAIDPKKDVDGFHPQNTGALFNGDSQSFIPCTPAGCIELLRSTGIELKGKKAVVIGRSNIVGKPMALLLLQENCTVTICHSRTKDLAAEVKQADIVVAAVGKAKIVTKDMIKPGAIVIDVGTNRVDGKLVGDVDFENVKEVAGYITPVPGGVGPMTIAMLMANTLQSATSSCSL